MIMMTTKYLRDARLALLLLGSMMAHAVGAQTYTNANYINTTQNLQVLHRQSFLADRADNMTQSFPLEFLQKGQGWKTNPYSHIQVQNTSEYYTTRYVKQGTWSPLFMTTNNNKGTASIHTFYQRWYYYDTDGSEKPLPQEYYAPENRAYRYQNGLVMGGRLQNGTQSLNGNTTPVTFYILSQLPNGKDSIIIGADLSRYSDLRYATANVNNAVTAGNLTEPSLTLRHYYKVYDAKIMARRLTAMTNGGNNWLEEHTIHFPSRTIGLRRDHVPLDLELQDYWFFTNNQQNNNSLQNIESDNYVVIERSVRTPNGQAVTFALPTFIDAPDNDKTTADGYDNIVNTTKTRRRLIGFQYPTGGQVPAGTELEIRVYARTSNANNATRFQLAKFTIIFDGDSETLPWMDILGEGAAKSDRSPQSLRALVGGADPVAHIDFDYPKGQSFTTPSTGVTRYNNSATNHQNPNTAFNMSSALPISFNNTNYGYSSVAQDNVYNWCVWGEYGIARETGQGGLKVYPVSRKTGDMVNDTLEAGFLYIDASDLPGTIATIPFQGTLCMGTKLMCTGWVASITNSVPGSVVLKVIGTKSDGSEKEIYAFCPGQIGNSYRRYNATTTTASSGEYCWQQFYFDFFLEEPCVSYELRVDNNCESTQGGDYFLDDIWVFAQLPDVGPDMTTPLCGGNLEVVQLETNFAPLLLASNLEEATTAADDEERYLSFVYLDWDKFLINFKQGLDDMGEHFDSHDLVERIDNGYFDTPRYETLYRETFLEALMRNKDLIEDSDLTIEEMPDTIVFGNFKWHSYFAANPTFAFSEMAHDSLATVYGSGTGTSRRLIFNGSMGIDTWEFYQNYALLTVMTGEHPLTSADFENLTFITELFDVLNECSNRSILWFVPKVQILGTIGGMSIDQVEFCKNTSQTFAMELTGYTKSDGDYTDDEGTHEAGDLVVLDEVYFDWWMGVPAKDGQPSIPATEENYRNQYIMASDGVTRIWLYDAVKSFRFMNPGATSLYDSNIKFGQNPLYDAATVQPFTHEMLDYLRSLAYPADGSEPQLYIHSKIVDIKVDERHIVDEIYLGDTLHYVKFVAVPIETNINEAAKEFVYICAEPQPFQVKVGDHAPAMRIGFSDKHYPADLGTLSVRISKSQFEKLVDQGDGAYNVLHIPLNDINVVTPSCKGVKMATNNVKLQQVLIANSTDSLMQDYIMRNYANLLPPPIGKVDYLLGRHDDFYSNQENERLLKMHFDKDFQVREGYSYTLRYFFIEEANDGSDLTLACEGNGDVIIKIVPDYQVWTGGAGNNDWSNDENWRRADYDDLYAENGTTLKGTYLPNGEAGDVAELTNFVTDADRSRAQGFAPLYCTNILMMTDETADAPLLYDDGDEHDPVSGELTGFPALRQTSSPLIRYDFQAHEWNDDMAAAETDESKKAVRENGDMVTELYQTNVCGDLAFQPETELVNAHLLDYAKAWVEFGLTNNYWHLVSSPLQATISGEWYAPTWSGRQETTYYEPIEFDVPTAMRGIKLKNNLGQEYDFDYDRFAPAVYQRAWDKAKAVVYERGAVWSALDGDQSYLDNVGDDGQGEWERINGQEGYEWNSHNADDYLQRLTYKPMGESKANVAVKGSWSGAYNDHTVPYSTGGFSLMPINNFKEHDTTSDKVVIRLPKEDYYYDIWDWFKNYVLGRRVRIYINDGRSYPAGVSWRDSVTTENTVTLENRGRLRSDIFADADTLSVELKNEGKGSVGFFLAANPFICGLDMKEFFRVNTNLAPYYLVLKTSDTTTDAELTPTDWSWTDVIYNGMPGATDEDDFQGRQVMPARHAFFVRCADGGDLDSITVKYTTDMMVTTPRASALPSGARPARVSASSSERSRAAGASMFNVYAPQALIIRAERDGMSSEARVELSPEASNTFRPEEDMETFVVSDVTQQIPVVYTLTGRLATSINRLHDFTVLPLGIESGSTEPATLTFTGVECMGQPLQLYDAYLQTLLPLKEGMKVRVPGATQNRFFIVTGLTDEVKAETSLYISSQEDRVRVTSTCGEPLTQVTAYDLAGRLIFSASPDVADFTFTLPQSVYVVKATTKTCRLQKKLIVD